MLTLLFFSEIYPKTMINGFTYKNIFIVFIKLIKEGIWAFKSGMAKLRMLKWKLYSHYHHVFKIFKDKILLTNCLIQHNTNNFV